MTFREVGMDFSGTAQWPKSRLLLYTLFCDKNRNLAQNHAFLLQVNDKKSEKIPGEHFLKQLRATWKNPANLMQNNEKQSKKH